MLPANPYGNQNYALSHRRLSSNSSGINTGASQPNQMTRNADNISFSTTAVGFMRLHVGKIITALSEYEKLLLSSVLAPDTEKKPCSAQPDNNGIYCWMVDLSQHRSSHLLHDAPDQVMVTSALDFSFSCIYRIMISDLNSQHSQLHCDASFDWTQNHHPEVSFNVVLPHPGQFSLQQLMCLKQVMAELEGLQSLDSAVQHQQCELASHQYLIADSQQSHESASVVVETPSFHHVNSDMNNYHITPQEAPLLDHTEADSFPSPKVPSHLPDNIANRLNVIIKQPATDEEIDYHIKRMFNQRKTLCVHIRESLNRAGLGADDQQIKERRDKFYKSHPLPDASEKEIIKHIEKVSGDSIHVVMRSIHRGHLRADKEYVTRLLNNWRNENLIEPHNSRRKHASDDEIMQHIKMSDATGVLFALNVIRSLHRANLGARDSRVHKLLKKYLQQKEDR